MLGVRMPMTATWIALRLLLLPLLYVPYRMGSSMRWAHEVDAWVKRLCFPLTEGADERSAQEVTPTLREGDMIPDVSVKQGEQMVSIARLAQDGPLLLVLYRGNWCPYSRLHLSNLAASHAQFDAAGIRVLGVTAYSRARWWKSKGVELAMADEPTGALFDAFGVRAPASLPNRVWGKLVPHESVFLFARGGKLVACDVRRLSSYKVRQKFLSADRILELAGAVRS
jgi:peroxiredoxin